MSDKASIIKEAQKYLARGQVDKAIAEWEKVAKEYPDGNSFNSLGDLYLKKGNKTDAINTYHRAADFFRREGFALKALALYKKILNINPSEALSLKALGELNEGKGLVSDAIKFYLAAADSLSKEGKKHELLETYEKILGLSPANIPLRTKVAEIYLREGLISEAAKQYDTVAHLFSEKGESEKAIGFCRKVLELQPLNKETSIQLMNLYLSNGDLENALMQIKEAAGLFPQDPDIILRNADMHLMSGKLDEAREYLGQVIEVEPANLKAKRLLADIYVKQGDRERAWHEYLSVLEEIILEENPDNAISLLSSFKDIDPVETGKKLVSLYVQLGDTLQAVHELIGLGEVFSDQGRQREALHCYKEALKMSPDEESLRKKVIELEKEIGKEHIVAGTEKTLEEALVEADIYLRYGLYENARELIETFMQKEPHNIDLHLLMKTLFVDTAEKEKAVAEYLALHELYNETGDYENSRRMIQEALALSPEDPRLSGMLAAHAEEATGAPSEVPSLEDYGEEIAEADFYARQGLIDEAREILERLQTLFPEDAEISKRLTSLSQGVEGGAKEEHGEERPQEEPEIAGEEVLTIEEIAEPALENEVLDIFNEFKKGLEKELEEEDYETHYNLGIAYKEMELIDDAIREFQTARNDPKKYINASNMLGICYMEKGLYPLAIEALKEALGKMVDRGEAFWAMKYDLAEAYEKNGDYREAFDFFTEIYGWNSKFRAVSDKIDQLKSGALEVADKKKQKARKDRVSYL
jgi:tetratricopeptide (TPR) repeat protein